MPQALMESAWTPVTNPNSDQPGVFGQASERGIRPGPSVQVVNLRRQMVWNDCDRNLFAGLWNISLDLVAEKAVVHNHAQAAQNQPAISLKQELLIVLPTPPVRISARRAPLRP